MQTSKGGSSVLMTSPSSIVRRELIEGIDWTRLVNSAAIRGSISTAVTDFAAFRISIVRFPVPGPTSRTWSDCLREALSTIACATPGFFKICWPKSVFILKMALAAADLVGLAYGEALEPPEGACRLWAFGILKAGDVELGGEEW